VKAQPLKLIHGQGYEPCTVFEATHLRINLPGPSGELVLPVIIKGAREGKNAWTWNADTERPTLRPSVLTIGGSEETWRCHSWINDGQAQFLDDCSHDLRGKTVPLLDLTKEAT
jgi:hypothetical protein